MGPDGVTTAAVIRDAETGRQDIWILELDRGVRTRFSFEAADNTSPVWSPDGTRIAYASWQRQEFEVLARKVDGGEVTPLWEHATDVTPDDWSPDGRQLIAEVAQPSGGSTDLWLIPVEGGEAKPWLATGFNEFGAAFSPDGRFVSYQSDESGAIRIYVASLTDSRRKVQVAGDAMFGGWNGRTWEMLFLTGPASAIQLVDASVEGERVRFGRPRNLPDSERLTPRRADSSTVPKGDRFLWALHPEGGGDAPIVLVADWQAVLARRQDTER